MKPRSKLFSFYNYMESKFVLPGIKATQKVTVSRREPGCGAAPLAPSPAAPAALSPRCALPDPSQARARRWSSPGVTASPRLGEEQPTLPLQGVLAPHGPHGTLPVVRCPHPAVPIPTALSSLLEQPQLRLRGRARAQGEGEGSRSPGLRSPASQELFAPIMVLFLLSGHFRAS